jgi:predicted TIM-barrel fold metal-dependent hydrolase
MLARARPLLAAAAASARPAGVPAQASIDVHTHVYLPRYMDMMRERKEVPRVVKFQGQDRLIILPGEDAEGTTAVGRPIGGEYFDVAKKLSFMDTHNIGHSIISLANPWLDFLPAMQARGIASHLNDDMQTICASPDAHGRLYGFGALPTLDVEGSVAEVRRIAKLPHMRGVIMGTSGIGRGLDDPRLAPLWAALEETGLTVFLHPHYGVGTEHFHGTGHALSLALGFPFETSVAVARLIVSGTLERHSNLKLLLAHSGGTLPYLIGRLDSCVAHDIALASRLPHAPSHYLRRLYFDALSYHLPTLQALVQFAGADRIFFGTDHPFFPPPQPSGKGSAPIDINKAVWPSTVANYELISQLNKTSQKAIMSGNAHRVFNIPKK